MTPNPSQSDPIHLPRLMADGLDISMSEARRHIAQGAVEVTIAGRHRHEGRLDVPRYQLAEATVRVGKRRWLYTDSRGEVSGTGRNYTEPEV